LARLVAIPRRSSPQGASYAEGVSSAILTQIITIMGSIVGADASDYYKRLEESDLKFKTPENRSNGQDT
jgi:hypothetical protein